MTELTTPKAIPERPALSPWYRVLPGDDRLLLEHGGTLVAFDGKAAGLLLPSLLPLLDGTRSVESIVDTLGAAIAPATRNALALLNERGALLDGPQPAIDDGPASEAAILAAALAGASAAAALESLSSGRIAVCGISPVADEITRILTGAGLESVRAVTVGDRIDATEVLVAAPGNDELGMLRSLNAKRLGDGLPWLQVVPNDGHVVVVGPLFVPGMTGCHSCYLLRRGACSGFEDDFERVARTSPNAGSPMAVTVIAAGIAGLLVLRWLSTRDSTLPGRFYALETDVVLGLGYHRLLRVPRCPSCGAGNAPMPSPWFNERSRDESAR